MPTRNVVLTDHQAALVDRLVSSGRYQNASEVLREGLRMIERRDADEQARLEALRAAVQVGIDDIEAGRYQVFKAPGEMRRYLKKLTSDVLAERRTSDRKAKQA
ncbi:MAG: type II toxin-antitoxin system ParD family antitoxin [Rhodospirillales bacterium]|nr:MAG: type II toxin-antitoxin system ParD family antitoxin [Rhodospirillales bacterium]